MEYSFIQANPIDHPGLIASLASQVWREHYGDLLPAEQIDYMLDKFQSEDAVRNQIQTGGYIYYILCVNFHLKIPMRFVFYYGNFQRTDS